MMPARGKVLVRPIETPETLAHGRILLTQQTREALTSHQMEIVSVGGRALCEDADCERYHSVPRDRPCKGGRWHPFGGNAGDWVLVAHRGLLETDEPNLYCCAQDDILAILHAPTL